MKITMDGKYKTRDGRGVRILCVDGSNPGYPVVAELPQGWVMLYKDNGVSPTSDTGLDLVEVRDRVPDDTPVDAKIWVRNSEGEVWMPAHFCKSFQGRTYIWACGTTIHTSGGHASTWKYSTLTEPKS